MMASFLPLDSPFDYIIVGGGTAGLVVASRLSEDASVRVLVIEAGPDHESNPLVLTPGLVAGLYGNPEYDWNFTSPPQFSLNNRRINQARGKMLGGSSGLNFMLMVYPSRRILDSWGELGNTGWNFDVLFPYFQKSSTVYAPPQSARDTLGLDYLDESLTGCGPLQVSFSDGYGPTNSAWMATFKNLGLEARADPRNGSCVGVFQNPASIDPRTKTRSYARTAYYGPDVSKRQNLVVLTETTVKKIALDTTSAGKIAASGVEIVTKDGLEKTIYARIEVILAAGTFHTPQLLELSGIGDKALLEQHGITSVLDNPGVGENVQDHPIVCQSFEVNDNTPSGDVLRDPNVLNALISQYKATGGGPLGQSNISGAFVPLADKLGLISAEDKQAFFKDHLLHINSPPTRLVKSILEANEPAVQHLLFPSQITISNHPQSMAEYLIPTRPENYITIMTNLNHPFSRGSVHITSNDHTDLPAWDPRYNSNPLDMEVLARNVQFVEQIVATEPFSSMLKPGGKRVPDIKADALESAMEIVRQAQISVFHVAGSCAMMPREKGGVVDERLRVYGVSRLRIVDASIFPLEPLGNIQSTVYAVAERAADIIKEDRAC
jgi:choline dehydrogenase-like flavoprotein